MVDFIVNLLNAIGNGIGQDQVNDLIKMPEQYNAELYKLSLNIAASAVKPVASIVLAVVFSLELARVSSRADGDRELGVKLVATAMLKCALVFTAAQHSELLLRGVDELGQSVIQGFVSAQPTDGGTTSLGLGDQMRSAIDKAGVMGQIPCVILLIIPFLVSQAASIVVMVIVMLRFVQIYMLTAFNPLPIAFLAHGETKQWGVNYFRQYATCVFQAATLYLAVIMYRAFAGSVLQPGSFNEGDNLAGWIIGNFAGLVMSSVLLAAIVMTANTVGKKLFGGE